MGQRESTACNDDGVDVSVGVDDDAVVSLRLVDPAGRALLVNVPFFKAITSPQRMAEKQD